MSSSAPTTRRTALAVLLTASLTGPLLAGCGVRWVPGDEPTPAPDRSPDDEARETAVEETLALLALLDVAASGPAPLSTVAQSAARTCAAHLLALGGTTEPPADAPAAPGPAPSAGGPSEQAQALVGRLGAAAAAAFTDATSFLDVSGPMARLLTSVAASRLLLAQAVGAATGAPVDGPALPGANPVPTPAASGSPGSGGTEGTDPAGTRALQAALAGEHAAVFAFALVVGRVDAARRAEAEADLAAHRVARDDLVDVLLARGAVPEPAAASYDAQAPTGTAAAALAATVEERLAATYADAVAASARDRVLAGTALVTAARDARRWGSAVVAFPGLPELGEDGSPVPAVPGVSSAPGVTATP